MVAFLAFLLLVSVVTVPCGLIDVGLDELIPLGQLAKRLPRRRKGRPTAPSTIHRWRFPGIKGVRLECVRIGGAWCTTIQCFREFCARLSELDTPAEAVKSSPRDGHAPKGDTQHQDRIERELDQELGSDARPQ